MQIARQLPPQRAAMISAIKVSRLPIRAVSLVVDRFRLLVKLVRTVASGEAVFTTSVIAAVPDLSYNRGLMNPTAEPVYWIASASTPANSGDERLVPPRR